MLHQRFVKEVSRAMMIGAALFPVTGFCAVGNVEPAVPYLARVSGSETKVPQDGTSLVDTLMYQLTYVSDTLAGRDVTSSTTPTVTVVKGNKTVTVTVDYGTTPVTTVNGKHTISGSFVLYIDLNTRSGSVTLNNVTVDSKSVSGTITLSNVNVTSSLFTATTQSDLTASGYGKIVGSLNYTKQLKAKTGFGIPSGKLTLTPTSGTPYTVTLASIVANAYQYRNFVPYGGTATIAYTQTVSSKTTTITSVVTFLSTSPVDGQVTVSVNGGTAYTMTLPGF